MTGHRALTGDELRVASAMQPRIEDYQQICTKCGTMSCRRCDGMRAVCECRRPDLMIIPVPCLCVAEAAMRVLDRLK